MAPHDDEEDLLRSVALQNAQSILQARQRAEEELVQAKEDLERKTAELATSLAMMRATLESTTDGILVTDGAGRVTSFNDRYVKMWGLPGAIMELKDHRRILEITSARFEDPQKYLSRIAEIYATSSVETYDLLELDDETTIERFSRVQSVAGRNVGRVWSFRDITERRSAEAERQLAEDSLRDSERELADFFENASVGLHWVGPDGIILRVNEAELELLGYSRDEYVGHHIAEFHVDQEVIADILARLAAGEKLRDREASMWCKDGSIKHVLIDSSVLWENGRFVHTRSFTRDVTDERRADEARARLAAIVESSQDAIIGKTLESRITSWNAAAERLFGYSALEAIGQSITMLIPPERIDEEDVIMTRLRRGEVIEHFETVRMTKDGHRIDISLTISPIRDHSGRVVGASKIARDITARRRAEETARFLTDASTALSELTDYRNTLHKVATLAVPLFADLCVVDMQEADGSVSRVAVVHRDPAKFDLSKDIAASYWPRVSDSKGVMKVLRTGESEWVTEITDTDLAEAAHNEAHLAMLRRLGPKSYIRTALRSRGRPLGVLTFVSAESGRIYSANDLAAAEDLARRASIAIENANLLATLKEADIRKDEFLAMLAHELRNPLAPIRNAVQIFRGKGPPNPDLQWATEVIDRQVHQMTRLVDDLLDVSRITRGKIELRKERVDLATVMNIAIEAGRPTIEKWGHELTVTIPPQPVPLDVDPTRMAQVLLNLLNNAAKYTDQGGRIWLSAERQGPYALVRVKDTGVGIPKEMLPRIFEMFTQVDSSLERSKGGLGIGLTLVKRLVEMHGGAVEARSDGSGKGSEFVVRLPVAVERVPTASIGALEAAGDEALRPYRILVVDDNRDAADSLGMLLRMMGNEVHTAHDGLEAVGAAAAFQPDVILLDIGLPKLNGYEAARRIRSQEGASSMMLIALTGWGQEEDRRRSKDAGFDHHLTKPVEFVALQKLLAETGAGRRR